MKLSETAQKLFSFLRDNGPQWEQNCIKGLFPEPKYIGTLDPNFSTEEKIKAQTEYWQYDVNCYGNDHDRPVNGEMIFFKATDDYSRKISAAYQELRKAGLAGEKNNGYNEYVFFIK